MKQFIFLISILSYSLCIAQTNIPDSLAHKTYQELSDSFYDCKPNVSKCLLYVDAYYKKASKNKDYYNMSISKYFLADIYNKPSLYLNYIDSIINLTKKNSTQTYPSALYLEKAFYLYHKNKRSKALKEITNAKSYLKKYKNDSLMAYSNFLLGTMQSFFGKKQEALISYRKAYNYYAKQKYIKGVKVDFDYLVTPQNIAYIHLSLNQLDSVEYYINLSEQINAKFGDDLNKIHLNLLKSKYSINKQKYNDAITFYRKSIKKIILDEDYVTLTSVYTDLGMCYDSLSLHKNAYTYHLKVDSLFKVRKTSTLKSLKSFYYLHDYHQKNKNVEKQLEYINKILELKEFYLNEKNDAKDIFTNEYDLPKLNEKRKILEQELKNKNNDTKQNTFLFLIFVLSVAILFIYETKKRRDLKKQYLKVINQNKPILIVDDLNTNIKTCTPDKQLPEKVVLKILHDLKIFEQNKGYLDINLNLKNLACLIGTNTNYLSKVINKSKETTYSNYITKLRIEYIIKELKENKKLQKYTIKAIANEAGYKNAESFSNAFYKYTELKPSYFIKELLKEV